MPKRRRTHGTAPDSRLVRIYLTAASQGDVFYAEIRRHTNNLATDGNGYRSVASSPQSGKKSLIIRTSAFARNTDEFAALAAALAVARARPSDDLNLTFPTEDSAAVYQEGLRHDWKYATPYVDRVFRAAERHTVSRIVVASPGDPVMAAAALRLAPALIAELGDVPDFAHQARTVEWTTKSQQTCTCDKSRFASKDLADLALLQFAGSSPADRGYTRKYPVRSYECPTSTWWHVTSKLVSRPSPPGQ